MTNFKKAEITTIRITDANEVHVRLSIWVNHALICSPGGICLRTEEFDSFVERLQPHRKNVENGTKLTEKELDKILDYV